MKISIQLIFRVETGRENLDNNSPAFFFRLLA